MMTPSQLSAFINIHENQRLYRQVVAKTLGVTELPGQPADINTILTAMMTQQQPIPASLTPAAAPSPVAAVVQAAAPAATSILKPLLLTALMASGIGGGAVALGSAIHSAYSPAPVATAAAPIVNINPAEWQLNIKDILDNAGKSIMPNVTPSK